MTDSYRGHTWSPGPWSSPVELDVVMEANARRPRLGYGADSPTAGDADCPSCGEGHAEEIEVDVDRDASGLVVVCAACDRAVP